MSYLHMLLLFMIQVPKTWMPLVMTERFGGPGSTCVYVSDHLWGYPKTKYKLMELFVCPLNTIDVASWGSISSILPRGRLPVLQSLFLTLQVP